MTPLSYCTIYRPLTENRFESPRSFKWGMKSPRPQAQTLDMVLYMCYHSAMDTEKNTNINTRYPADVYAALKRFAQEDQRSFHSMVMWILRLYIKQRQGK